MLIAMTLIAALSDPVVTVHQTDKRQAGAFVQIEGQVYVLTTAHGLEAFRKCSVNSSDNREYPAHVMFWSKSSDLAIISGDFEQVPSYELGSSKQDAPLSVWLNHKQGFYSAFPAVISDKTDFYVPLGLRSGDSGGPVLNMKGEIVAIVSGGWLWRNHVTWPARLPIVSRDQLADFLTARHSANTLAPGPIRSFLQKKRAIESEQCESNENLICPSCKLLPQSRNN